jgi:small subunit ribosomal protein S11
MAKIVKKPVKKVVKRVVNEINVNIKASFNNTIITITDLHGNTLGASSAGSLGFRGARKSTPFAASQAAEEVIKKVLAVYSSREAYIFIKGAGPGRDGAARAIGSIHGLRVKFLMDITRLPHNGVRPKKRRRV